MVLGKVVGVALVMVLMVWVDGRDTESADLWTWHDPGAYEACVAAGGSPDVGNVLRRNAAIDPQGHLVGIDWLHLEADGGWWQLSTHDWTYAVIEEPVPGTAGLAAATGATIASFDGDRATFETPWDWKPWFEAQPWQHDDTLSFRQQGTTGAWTATWWVPECALAPGGHPLQQRQSSQAAVWITPDDQVQGILYEPGAAGDAIQAMPGWYGDWRTPHYEGLQPVASMSRPGPW